MSSYTLVPVRAVRNDLVTQTDYIVYVPLATTTTPGIVKIGTGLVVDSTGLLTIDDVRLGDKIDEKIQIHNALENNTVHPYLQQAINTVASDLTTHTMNTSNPHAVTKTQVGLSNVDNTSDLNKPVSVLTQTALSLKVDKEIVDSISVGAGNKTNIGHDGTAIYLMSTVYNPQGRNGRALEISSSEIKLGRLQNNSWIYENIATEDFVNEQGFVKNTVNNLINYYLKTETYTQTEVDTLIANIHTISFQIVQELPETGSSNIIYLVPVVNTDEDNIYEEYVWIDNAWEMIGTTQVDLSNYLSKDNVVPFTPTNDYNPSTKKYVDDETIANIGNIQVLDFGYTRTGTTLTGSPTTPISITNLIAERIYLIDGDWAVSNDWINTDTVKFVLSDNTEINILTEKNTSGIGKVGDLNQVKFPYDAETGHRTIFFAKLIYKNNQYFFGLVPSVSGQDIVSIDCETLVDYSTGEIPFPYNNGQKFYCYNSNAMYFQDHIYNAVYNYTTSTVSFTDLKVGGVSVDNTTITKNAQDIISAIGLTDGTNITTAGEIRGAISIDRAGVKSLSNGTLQFTMAQFEALATVDTNTEYDLTDHPSDSITNEQMVFALTCNRLFPAGATYICQDNGTYSAAHIYQIVVNGGTKSWLDMTSTLGYAIRTFL